MKFPIKGFFSKGDQIRSFLRIWSHFLKESLIENFTFCAGRIMTLIITEKQRRNIRTTSIETLKERLKQREHLWIMKLETLAPHGMN